MTDGLGRVEFTDDSYTVEHGLVGNDCQIYDDDGELLVRADERAFTRHGELPFVDDDGEEVFRLEPGNVDGDYFVVPADGDRPLVIVEEDFSFLQHRWNVRRGRDERLIAVVEAAGPSVELVRYYLPLLGMLPHTYTIEDPDGDDLGVLSRRLGVADTYVLEVDAVDELPREALVTAALSVDILDSR